ncbi:MAG: glycine cleavage system aminomethyltransferase GcvT, partial [Marmoricola sp.]
SGVVAEHNAVRNAVGLFDVSHLGKVMVCGEGAVQFLNACLSNNLRRITRGKAQYTLACDAESGGIVDDLIAYYRDDQHILLIPNAANAAEVVRRLKDSKPAGVTISDHHETYAVLAVQGPQSDEVLKAAGFPFDHDYMSFVEMPFEGHNVVVCRTGYTGERGYELIVHESVATGVWDALTVAGDEHGLVVCGLGARDTLRTEMGYPLHGQDISLDVTPVEAGLGWAVGWSKAEFWGRVPLLAQKQSGPKVRLRGLVAAERAIPRPSMTVKVTGDMPIGFVTSGTFSPTLRKGVGLAIINAQIQEGTEVLVDVRGRPEIFVVTQPPFVDPDVRQT